MKIKLLKSHKFGTKTFKKETELEVLNEVGKVLIREKKAVASDHVTLTETHVESKIEDEAEEEFMALPTDYNARAIALQTCTNEIVLKKCLEDTRITVSLAAQKQLDKLSS